MNEQIQPLLERIQSEGLQKAETERERILSEARSEAESLLANAREEAAAIQETAKAEAAATLARGTATLEQAARDLLLRLRTELSRQLQAAAAAAASSSLSSSDIVSDLLRELVKEGGKGAVTVETNPELGETLKALLPSLLKDVEGEVIMNPKAGAGFSVRFSDSPQGMDVSADAVAEWLAASVRPELASLLKPSSTEA